MSVDLNAVRLGQMILRSRRSPKRAGSTCMSESIAATMTLLQEAKRKRTASLSLEEGPYAEPVAGQDMFT